ncbi:hypothetical protein [Desulfosporosinus fructosivorans]
MKEAKDLLPYGESVKWLKNRSANGR